MKNLLFCLLLAIGLVSCAKDEIVTGKLDPNATINLRYAASTSLLRSASAVHLTALEIVKQTTNLKFTYNGELYGRGFADAQRDTITPMLKMWGTDIIAQDGTYEPIFIEATDCILQRVRFSYTPDQIVDTIAYIPNSILREAQVKIKAAYDAQNYTECYAMFDTVFVFIPISGSEWRALKALDQE